MAIYNNDADPATAVAAFLAQNSISNTGDVRRTANTDTFHVTWLHRALQHKVYDFTTAGDDLVQLSDPNPSTTAALGQIIKLEDQTPNGYTHRYNIDALVAETLFGGSVSQKDAGGLDEAWYPLQMSGSADAAVELQVVQNNVQLASYWGTGINQTQSGVLNRILVKAVDAGVLIDGGVVTVKGHDFSYGFAHWTTTLGLTEQSAFISADVDAFNDTAVGTVSAYGISKSEGYNLLDLDDTGPKPYLGSWSYTPETTKKALYEYAKYILSRDSGETLYGVPSNLWTGRVYRVPLTAGTGGEAWVQNEAISWPGGTGQLMAFDAAGDDTTADVWLHLNTGVPPVSGDTISGAVASQDASADGVALATSPNHLGQFTGSWLAAEGIGFDPTQVTTTDSFKDVDGNAISPPNFVSISGTVNCVDAADEPHVFFTLRSGTSPNYTQQVLAGPESIGAASVTIGAAIPSNTPVTGWIGLLETGGDNYVFYEYSSWAGSTFNLVGTLAEAYAAGDDLMMAYFYETAAGAGTSKTVARSLIYDGTPIDIIGWVRQGDEAAPDSVIPFSGQIGAGGYSFTANLSREV